MLHHFKEYGYFAEITGFRGVSFETVDAYLKANRKLEKQKVWLQFFDSELIASSEHLHFAVLNALLAFKNRANLSKSLAMEIMLYASCQRQIQKAIGILGVKPETLDVAVVIVGQNSGCVKELLSDVSAYLGVGAVDDVLELTPKKAEKIKGIFEITEPMLKAVSKQDGNEEALVSLVIEKVALLATQL